MPDTLAAFNVLEVQVTAGLPGPPGGRGSNGLPGAPDTPYFAAAALRARDSITRASDRINIADDVIGNGTAESSAFTAWLARFNAGYTHDNSSTVAATARGGYISGGFYDAGAPTVLSSSGFGYSLFGDGRVSQLENVTVETMHVNTRLKDFAIIGDGTGKGLDIRSSNLIAQALDIQNHDVAITASRGSLPGGLGANNTVAFGSLRSSRIGAVLQNLDTRLMFLRTAFLDECGIDNRDSGGNHILGCNIFCDNGPAIRWTGGNFTFTGNVVEDEFTISNISDFTNIREDDIIISAGNLASNTRVTDINSGAGTITVDRAGLATTVGAALSITRIPIESFYVDNTLNAGRTDYLEFPIATIRDAGGGQVRIVTTNQNFKLSNGTNRLRFENTGVAAYDDNSAPQTRWITAIEDWNTIVVNMPYVSDVTGVGVMKANNYDAECHSGNAANFYVREHFFVGNNFNQSLWQGGVAFNFFGTRLNARITLDGFRPFRGTASIGSPIVTAITGINTNELREGVVITTSTASFPVGTVIESVDSATQITLSENATENAAGTLFSSPHTPNGFFHISPIDNATRTDIGVAQPSGPGATVGWAQISMFPDFAFDYAAAEGGYWVGPRVPYTAGGMKDGQAQYLNEIGPTNTGIHIRSNSVKHFLRGSEWVLDDNRTFTVASIATANAGASILLTLEQTCPLIAGVDRVYLSGTSVVGYDNVEAVVEAKPRPDQIQLPIAFVSDATGTLNTDASLIIFREGFLANEAGAASGVGVRIRSSGRPMVMEARAYLNNGGTVYGNSMFRWRAPRSTTAADETANGGGFAVLPGNSINNVASFILGATNAAVDLTGDAASIRALANTTSLEIDSNGSAQIWHNQNAATRLIVNNSDAGTAAQSTIEARNAEGASTSAIRMTAFGTGFTTAGYKIADSGLIEADSLLSEGLVLASVGNAIRFYTGATPSLALTLGATGGATVAGVVRNTPSSSVTLGQNGQFEMEATNNTTLTFKYRGSDGTTRTATMALA